MSNVDLIITTCLAETSIRLNDAAAIAKVAVTYATAGFKREALRIAMDSDRLLHEVQTLHGAVCLIGRMTLGAVSTPPAG